MYSENTLTNESSVNRIENVVFLLGLMKLILVAAFFASFAVFSPSTANAQEAEACSGRNLLEVMKKEDPARFDAVMAEAAAVRNASSVFWKLEKPKS